MTYLNMSINMSISSAMKYPPPDANKSFNDSIKMVVQVKEQISWSLSRGVVFFLDMLPLPSTYTKRRIIW